MKNNDITAVRGRILENFERSFEDIMRGLEKFEFNIKQKEILDFTTREEVLDASFCLEAAVCRALIYNTRLEQNMQPKLQKLNETVNRMSQIADSEFLKILNLKIASLLELYITY